MLNKIFYKQCDIKFSYPLFTPYLSLYANVTFSKPKKAVIKKFLNEKKVKK